jgi:ribosomal protein L11 methyltransferase
VGHEIVTHFPAALSEHRLRAAIEAVDDGASVSIAATPAVDWSALRASVAAHRIGSLTIAPPWLAPGLDPATTIVIDPAMAFGTGEHATTRTVIRLMQRLDVAGSTVADLGAGSAILSIVAARLGASRVIAIEQDIEAAGNAIANIAANGADGLVHYIEGDAALLLPLIGPVDLVVANILSPVLMDLLPLIKNSLVPGRHAILSGILMAERSAMLAEIESGGWSVEAEDLEEEWWSVLIARP